MRISTMGQSHTLNLLRNGALSRGSAYWWGSYLRHKRIGGSQGQGTVNAPEYGLEVFRAADTSYPSTVTAGAHQWLDRPDLFTYPSRRVISGLLVSPFAPDRAMLQVLQGLTAVDGAVLAAKPAPVGALTYVDLFQHPFVHLDTDQTRVNIAAGSTLPLTDNNQAGASGLYRVGALLENRSGTAMDTPYDFGAPNVNQYSYHGLEISPLGSAGYEPLITEQTWGVVSTWVTVTDGVVTVTIQAAKAVIEALVRPQPGSSGIQVGDVFTMVAPSLLSGSIVSVSVLATQTTVVLIPLTNYGQVVIEPFSSDINPEQWAIYTTSTATVTRTLPLYSYDFTLGYTCRINAGYGVPGGSAMSFHVLDGDAVEGMGRVSTTVPRVIGQTKVVNLIADQDTVDGAWQRRLERHVRESAAPIEGRLELCIEPPAGSIDDYPTPLSSLPNAVFWAWFTEATGSNPDLNDPPGTVDQVPHFKIECPYDINNPPQLIEWSSGFKTFSITTFGDPTELYDFYTWIPPLLQLPSFTIAAAKLQAGLFSIYVEWDVDTFGPLPSMDGFHVGWLDEFTATWGFNIKGLKGSGGRSLISDIYLAHGDLAQRMEQRDDISTPVTGPLTNTVSIDPLRQGIDLVDHVLPPGTVMLYAGGGTCPPGFKRVEGFPGVALPGIGAAAALALDQATVTYLAAQDRTRFLWVGTDFPLLDENGLQVQIPELALSVSKPIPGFPESSEEVAFAPVQQVVQPGMSLRIPDFLIDPAILASDQLFTTQTAGSMLGLPSSSSVDILRPKEPLFKRMALEIWWRPTSGLVQNSEAAISWLFRKAKNIGSDVVGWGAGFRNDVPSFKKLTWRIQTNGSLGFRNDEYTTFSEVFTTDGGSGNMLHLLIEFGVPSSGTAGAPGAGGTADLRILLSNTDIYALVDEAHNFGVNQAGGDLTPGALLRIGETPDVGADSSGYINVPFGAIVDNFRLFELDSAPLTSDDRVALWNGGKGLSVVPINLQSRLITELRLDEGFGTVASDTAPVSWTTPATVIGSATWLAGYIQAQGGSDFDADDYRAPFEDKDRSYLVTRVESVLNEAEGVFESGTPYTATNNGPGNGQGTVLYPFAVADSELMASDINEPVLGPGFAGQTETFADGTAMNVMFWLAKFFKGLVQNVQTFIPILTTTPPDWAPQVGDVYFIDWYNTDTPTIHSGHFLARVTDINYEPASGYGNGYRYTFERYDGRHIELSAAEYALLQWGSASGGHKGQIRIRPAKLFGVGHHVVDTSTGSIIPQGVVRHSVAYNGVKYWVVRKLINDLLVEVQGRAPIPDGLEAVRVEATGYLRYDDPLDTMDYGAGGHSHRIGQPLTAADDLIPRISETGALKLAPYVSMAQNHDHGFLSQYRFPLPEFRILTACLKL